MHNTKKPNKRNRNIPVLAGFIIILAVIIIIKLLAEPFIERRLAILLDKSSVTAQEIHLRWILPGIKFKGISIKSTSDSLKTGYGGEIQSVDLKHINILKLITRKGIKVGRVEMEGGRLIITTDSKAIQEDPLVFKKDFILSEIVIKDIELIFFDKATLQTIHSKGISIQMGQVDISPQDTFTISGINITDFNAESTAWYTPDSLYTFSINGVRYSDISEIMSVDSIGIRPRYPPIEFVNRFEYQTDRIEGIISEIRINDLSVEELIEKGDMQASDISIGSFSINAFRDKRKKFNHKPRKMLQELIYSFPGRLTIDSLHLNKGRVLYAEQTENSDKAGYVQFSNITAAVGNVTNDTLYRNTKGYLRIKASGLLMSRVPIITDYVARLYDDQHTFSLKGQIGEFNLDALNSFYETNESIKLSGSAHKINFEFTANNQEAIGSLTFFYDELSIEINDKGFFRDKLKTWFANYRLVNSNPMPGKEVRIGKIDYKRDPERFLFNYSVKALMTGIRSTVLDD